MLRDTAILIGLPGLQHLSSTASMMTRRLVRISFAVALLTLAAGFVGPSFFVVGAAGQVSPPPRFDLVEQWLQAVEQHAPGVQDQAILSVNSWNRDDLSQILLQIEALVMLAREPGGVINFRISRGEMRAVYTGDDLKRLRELGKRAEALGDRALLRRGVLLHTDAAILSGGDESHGLGVAHLSDDDHIGRLPQR